jgi:DNA-binding IclR family transcriptional regulator
VKGIKLKIKSLRLLEVFTPPKKERSIRDRMEALGYHKSSIQRFVSTLEDEGA